MLDTIILTAALTASPFLSDAKQQSAYKELECLAKNIYYEARNQSKQGKAAIGFVTMNRVKSKRYPNSVCKVVHQKKQFSWTRLAKSKLKIKKVEQKSWAGVVALAVDIYTGKYHANPIGKATHFHKSTVKPQWAKKLKRVKKIGKHIFYR